MYIAYVKPNKIQVGCVCTSTEYVSEGDLAMVGTQEDYWVGTVAKTAWVREHGDEMEVLECGGELPKIIGRGTFYVRDNNS